MNANINAALKMDLWDFGDLDDALVRPGRCIARLYIRELTQAESAKLLTTLVANDSVVASVTRTLTAKCKNTYSLAEIYSAIKNTV
jgi:transcriptional regulator